MPLEQHPTDPDKLIFRAHKYPPVATGIERMVCEEIALRQQKGLAKYGTTVADNNLSLREWLQHALEESLDQAIYLRRAIAEIDKQSATALSQEREPE
jgi:hypothetical protein